MGEYVADQVVKLMLRKGIQVLNSKVLILGFTFKENCPDVRNTKVIDIVHTLEDYQAHGLILQLHNMNMELNFTVTSLKANMMQLYLQLHMISLLILISLRSLMAIGWCMM
jgi:UDP-N-acetyl-D-mannosaminuronate dehydrogenase